MKGKKQEKKVKTSKVQYSSRPIHKRNGLLNTRGYTYFPRISIAGLWLEELGLPIKEVSRQHKDSDVRYETKSGHYFKSGCRVEALISDGLRMVPYWVRTSIEHDGKDYFLAGYHKVKLEGLKVRLRGRA